MSIPDTHQALNEAFEALHNRRTQAQADYVSTAAHVMAGCTAFAQTLASLKGYTESMDLAVNQLGETTLKLFVIRSRTVGLTQEEFSAEINCIVPFLLKSLAYELARRTRHAP